jgi:hypothetical protein
MAAAPLSLTQPANCQRATSRSTLVRYQDTNTLPVDLFCFNTLPLFGDQTCRHEIPGGIVAKTLVQGDFTAWHISSHVNCADAPHMTTT